MNRTTKSLGQRIVDATIVPLVHYTMMRVVKPTNVLVKLNERAANEAADYAQERMAKALSFLRRESLWDHALSKRTADGIIAEFGVWSGYSINYIARKCQSDVVYGFDSFEGLREDWHGSTFSKGAFDLQGQLPTVLPNVQLIKGWFHETVPVFLSRERAHLSFVHVDCDTYEATQILLDLIADRLRLGTVIVFDEYFGYRGWQLGEFKAWHEFVIARQFQYEYLGFSIEQVAVRITGVTPVA